MVPLRSIHGTARPAYSKKPFTNLFMNRLKNKVAVITGGNSIGLATAKAFLAEGATVVFTGPNADSLERADTELGGNAYGMIWDAADENGRYRLADFIRDNFERIDVLFIRAGATSFAPIAQMTEEIFDQSMNTNVKETYFTIQALLPLINEGGSIILNTSIASHIREPGASVHAATKAALLTLAKNLSAELLPRRIRVNAVSPGPAEPPLDEPAKPGSSQPQSDQPGGGMLKPVLLGRFDRPEEIVKVVTFLASDDSTFVQGAELIVDGGMSAL